MNVNSNELGSTRMLLVTANVGTIFENLDQMLDIWLNEITNKISELEPEFIALHLQEVGGKNYKQSMQSVDIFYKKFFTNSIIRAYNRYLVLIDSDFTDDLTFTSLNNIYLIHKNLTDVELYNFEDKSFFKYQSRQMFSGNLKFNRFFHKERFEKSLFKEFQWSRKGFLQTKWRIRNNVINLLNIHLFHDASNLVALNSSPSIYSEYRRKALTYTLEIVNKNKSLKEEHEKHAFAIFGDFNFRLDLKPLVDNYTIKTKSSVFKDENNKLFKLVLNDSQNKEIFTIEEKKFKWNTEISIKDQFKNLLMYDKELTAYNNDLVELDINFPPSYPFMEDLINYEQYMESRCPAWCDRVLISQSLGQILKKPFYGMIGRQACMGDHKPIYLFYTVNNSNINEPVMTNINNNKIETNLNYVYINNNLSNLDKLTTDVHDYAWFNNINQLKSSLNYPFDYILPNLLINNNNSNNNQIVEQPFRPILNKSSQFKVKLKQEINLTDLVKSILIYLKETSNHNKQEVHEFYYVKFFTHVLNANFFKLKHLLSYLDDLITNLKNNTTSTSDVNNNSQLDFTQLDPAVISIDFSQELSLIQSIILLNETKLFLLKSCTHSLFKTIIEKNTSIKKLSIYSSIFH